MRLDAFGWWRNARCATSWTVSVDAAGRVRATFALFSIRVRWTAPYPAVRSSGGLSSSLTDASLPPAERQFVIEDQNGNFVARVDFAYPDLKVAIECDSKKHHFGRGDWERDVERHSRLSALWLARDPRFLGHAR